MVVLGAAAAAFVLGCAWVVAAQVPRQWIALVTYGVALFWLLFQLFNVAVRL